MTVTKSNKQDVFRVLLSQCFYFSFGCVGSMRTVSQRTVGTHLGSCAMTGRKYIILLILTIYDYHAFMYILLMPDHIYMGLINLGGKTSKPNEVKLK